MFKFKSHFYHAENPSLHEELKSVTIIFLYIYPTLLSKLIPFLARMTNSITSKTKLIATVTYHIKENDVTKATLEWKDDMHDICFYSKVYDYSSD